MRITPSPLHTPQQTLALIEALDSVWTELGLKRVADWSKEPGTVGASVEIAGGEANLWTPAQLGLENVVLDAAPVKETEISA